MNKISLLDTNVLIYAINTDSSYHKQAKILRDRAVMGIMQACITPQVLWEFFAVITDSKRIEKPLSTQDALQEIQSYWNSERLIKILPNEHTFMTVGMLIHRYNISGQHIHDAYLIGTMLDNNVHVIYSGDETLKRFEEITAVNPFM